MTPRLLRTVGALGLALILLTGAATAAPAVDSDATTDAIGPPGGLPDQVPDFVTTILELIQEFLTGGSNGTPGPDVSDAAGGDGG